MDEELPKKRGRPTQDQLKVNKKLNHYVDNKEFLRLLIEYKATPTPRTYEKIGVILLKITQRMILMGKYVNYDQARKNEMISTACYFMLKYGVSNFDPTKSKNPFAFMSEITKNAFHASINKEKERDRIYSSLGYIDTLEDSQEDYE